jgi:hypothetical protein
MSRSFELYAKKRRCTGQPMSAIAQVKAASPSVIIYSNRHASRIRSKNADSARFCCSPSSKRPF